MAIYKRLLEFNESMRTYQQACSDKEMECRGCLVFGLIVSGAFRRTIEQVAEDILAVHRAMEASGASGTLPNTGGARGCLGRGLERLLA